MDIKPILDYHGTINPRHYGRVPSGPKGRLVALLRGALVAAYNIRDKEVYEKLVGYISLASGKRSRALVLYTSYSWCDGQTYPIPTEGSWVDYDATANGPSSPRARAGETVGVPGAVPGGLVGAQYLHSPAAAFAAVIAAAASACGQGMPDLNKGVFRDCGMLVAESTITPPEYWGASPTHSFTQTIKFSLTTEQASKLDPRGTDPNKGLLGAYLFVGCLSPNSAGLFSASKPIPVENPRCLSVKVNGRPCLPQGGVVPDYPVDLTPALARGSGCENKVDVAYMSASALAVAVVLARRHTPQSLVALIQDSNRVSADSVRQKFFGAASGADDDDLISEGALVSLKCPLGQCRIRAPARAAGCQHSQCFDCETFLQFYQNRPTWKCPVCSAVIQSWRELVADSYFESILKETAASDDQIYIEPNGDWRRKDAAAGPLGSPAAKARPPGVVEAVDGVDVSDASTSPSAAPTKRRRTDYVDLTVDSDSDDAEDPFDLLPVTQEDIDMIAAIEADMSSDAGSQPASQRASRPTAGASADGPAATGAQPRLATPQRARPGAGPTAAPATGPAGRHRGGAADAARRRTVAVGVRADDGSPTAARAARPGPAPSSHRPRKVTARRPPPRVLDATAAHVSGGPASHSLPSTPTFNGLAGGSWRPMDPPPPRPPIVGMSPSYTSLFLNGQLDGAQRHAGGFDMPGDHQSER
ncbi:E3 SUMO-protein ligase pli1 [Coemansia spiralis]|nr:E3 SUMO-protein ligase pli1 [Coemansia spiralis]